MSKKYGKVALVAGASQGLGAAYSEALAKEGYDLILIARGKDQLEITAQKIREQNKVKVTSIPCDLSDADAVQKMFETIRETEVDFLVYNAAIP